MESERSLFAIYSSPPDNGTLYWQDIQRHLWRTFRRKNEKQDTSITYPSTKDFAVRGVPTWWAEEEILAFSYLDTPNQCIQLRCHNYCLISDQGKSDPKEHPGISNWHQRTGAPGFVRGRRISFPLIGPKDRWYSLYWHCVVQAGSPRCKAGLFWLHWMRLCGTHPSREVREGDDGGPGELWAEHQGLLMKVQN